MSSLSTPREFLIVTDVSEWKQRLISKEDPFHIHKTLALACLCSFVWRYMHTGRSDKTDMAFLTHPELTIPTVLLHFLLTASAFVFKIPQRRIRDGSRIWPEYRMHALIFLTRSLVVMVRYWYEDRYHLPRWYDFNFFAVLATLAAADGASYSVRTAQSNSVRNLETHPAVRYFFSVTQFQATSALLMGQRRYAMCFLIVAVVQLTPFMATLRRKNLLGRQWMVFLYGVLLVFSGIIGNLYSPGATVIEKRVSFVFGYVAALWRMLPLPKAVRWLQNKYLIWCTLGLLMRRWRDSFPHWTLHNMLWAVRYMQILVVLLGYYKTYYEDGYKINRIGATVKKTL